MAATTFTKEQSELVKESWQMVKQDSGTHAFTFFTKIFEIAPGAKQLFSFLRDSSDIPLDKIPKLKAHALTVFKLTGDSAAMLGEKGAVEALHPRLKELGRKHVGYGVIAPHFETRPCVILFDSGTQSWLNMAAPSASSKAIRIAEFPLFQFSSTRGRVPLLAIAQRQPSILPPAWDRRPGDLSEKACSSAALDGNQPQKPVISYRQLGDAFAYSSPDHHVRCMRTVGGLQEVVKTALLATIESLLPDDMPAERKKATTGAWSQAYDELAGVMLAEMQVVRDTQTSAEQSMKGN